MGWWIGLGVLFVVIVVALTLAARKVRQIEDDSSYVREEQGFSPYGSYFVRVLRGRRDR